MATLNIGNERTPTFLGINDLNQVIILAVPLLKYYVPDLLLCINRLDPELSLAYVDLLHQHPGIGRLLGVQIRD